MTATIDVYTLVFTKADLDAAPKAERLFYLMGTGLANEVQMLNKTLAVVVKSADGGLNGTVQQQDSINALLTGPKYTTGVRQGEEAILQNASATGGLRGGNTNNSLANFRADLLAQTFTNQFQRLGQVSSLGQNAASGVGNAGLATANNIGTLLQQQGAATAGGQIAAGNVVTQNLNTIAQLAGTVIGATKGPTPQYARQVPGF